MRAGGKGSTSTEQVRVQVAEAWELISNNFLAELLTRCLPGAQQ